MTNKPYYIDVYENSKDSEIVSYIRDNDGVLSKSTEPLSNYLYCYQLANGSRGDKTNIYGQPLRRVDFDNKRDLNDYSKRYDDLCMSDVSASNKFIFDNFMDASPDSPVNIMMFDIEVEVNLDDGDGYADPSNAFEPINCIQMYSYYRDTFFIIIPDRYYDKINLPSEVDGTKVKVIPTLSEREMLLKFIDLIEDEDILSAWNSNGFDTPYIYARLEKLFGKQFIGMLSRDNHPAYKRSFINKFGKEQTTFAPVGRHILDLMEVYKKMIPGEKESFSLDFICELELGEKKVEYTGDLGTLLRENPQKFFEYSLRDVVLLKKLEDSKKLLRLSVLMSRDMMAKPADVTGAVKLIELGLQKFCLGESIILPDKKQNDAESFDGAIVYQCLSGVHKWMFTIDLSGLYPSVMRMLGCSPETKIMKLVGGYDDYVSVMARHDVMIDVYIFADDETISINAADLEDVIRSNGYTISPFGIVFTGEHGILSRFVEHFVDKRAYYRGLIKEAAKVGDNEAAERYDLYQLVYKIAANSTYGVSGQISFKLYDLDISASITSTAQIISKFQAQLANQLTKSTFGG